MIYKTLEDIQKDYPLYTGRTTHNATNLVGQKFGHLTVIYKGATGEKRTPSKWVCKCDCGNYCAVETYRLTHEQKVCDIHCPLKGTKLHDLTGKKFGHLTVIKRDGITSDGHARWLCQCDCGNYIQTSGRYLEQGFSSSCGNCGFTPKSKGNLYISTWLQEHNINFVAEYRFKDCKDKSTLPFDFCVLNDDNSIKCLIEYNGNLHYRATGGWISEEHLVEQKRRDQIKIDYCKSHNYSLLIISYKDKNIDKILKENILNA